MKTSRISSRNGNIYKRFSILFAAAAVLAATFLFAQGAKAGPTNYIWNVTGGNWSSPGSWTPNGTPAGVDTATFGNANESASPSTINNTVDSGFAGTIANLNYTNFEQSGSYVYPVTLIQANKILFVTNSLLVGGFNGANGNNQATYAYIVGGGTLDVTAPSFVVQNASTSSGNAMPCAYLDLSGLTNFIYNSPNGFISICTNEGAMSGLTRFGGSMTLAHGSNNITANALSLGTSTSAQGGPGMINTGFGGGVQNNDGPLGSGNAAVLTLGPGTNIINANTIIIANEKYGFEVTNSGGGLRIRGVTGADSDANVNITVGNRNVNGGSGQTTGWLLLNGCPVDIKANSLIIGERIAGSPSTTDGGAGLLQFDTGTISANSFQMAYDLGSGGSQVNALVDVGANAKFIIGAGQLFALATASGSSPSTGTLVVSNGLINCMGPIVMGPNTNSVPSSGAGFATGVIQLIGAGQLFMGPNSYIGTATNPITDLILDTNSVLSISIPSPSYTNICVQNLSWPSPDTNLTISVAAIPAGITNNEIFPFLSFSGSMTNTFNNPKLVLPPGVAGNLYLSGGGNTIFLTLTAGVGPGIGGVNELLNSFFILGGTNWTATGSGASLVSTNSTYPNTGGCTVDTRNVVPLPGTGANVAKLTGSFVGGGSVNSWSQTAPVAAGSQITPGASVYVAHEDIMSGADSFYFELDFLDANNNLIAAYESSTVSNLTCGEVSPFPLDSWNLMALTNQMRVSGGVNTGILLSNTTPIIQIPAQTVNARFKAVFVQRNATDTGSAYFSGANVGFLLAPVPPAVASITPNLVTLSTNQYLSCTVTSSITTISSFQVTATTTTLGGTATSTTTYNMGSPGLSVAGLGTPSATVSVAIATNTIYQSVVVTATDADNVAVSSAPASFDTLTPNLVIEAGDFNFSSGSFIDTPANGGFALYQGKTGVQGVDENKITRAGTQSYYRPADATIVQAADSTSGTEQKFVTAAANGDTTDIEVAIGTDSSGDWQNYSRTFGTSGADSAQAGTYNVWCYLATSGSGSQVGFYQVTSNPDASGQSTNFIGDFGSSTFSDNSFFNYVYAPLVDQFGNRVTLTITNGVQTFRGQIINSDTPNVAFYMLTPVVPVYNPVFLYVYPTTTFEPSNAFEFVVGPAQGASITTNGIGITLNGVPVTSGLTFTPFSGGGWTVTLPIASNAVYSVALNVTNLDGVTSYYTNNFDTFSQNNFMIEADEFDFNGGQWIDNSIQTATAASAADSYYFYPAGNENNSAEYGIDYTTTNVTGETYLYRVDGNTPDNVSVVSDAAGTEVTSDFLRDKFYNEGPSAQPPFEYVPSESVPATNTDYDLAWWTPGTWLNYTRTFPTNTYRIWGRLASSSPYTNATVSLVTAGQGTITQTTQVLGNFADPNANGFQVWHWVPLTDTNGQPITLSMGGVETLQITAPSGSATGSVNGHFYMLAPYVAASRFPVRASLSGTTVSIQFPTQPAYNYTVYYSTSLNPANWQTLTSISGNGAVETVTDSASNGVKRFYRVQAQ